MLITFLGGWTWHWCHDPPPPVGTLVLVIQTFPAPLGSKFGDVDSIVIETQSIEAVHRTAQDGAEEVIVIDDAPRTILLPNDAQDVVVGMFQVPVGFVSQVRVRASRVVIKLKGGDEVELEVGNPDLPSWAQSGWKIASESGALFSIRKDELSGMRGLMDFSNRLVRPTNPKGPGWKIKPTIDAEPFAVNPQPDEPGLFLDQLTVVFRPGTTPAQVQAINAAIGATVLISPTMSWAYRIKIPSTIMLDQAAHYYAALPQVQGVLPGTNYAQYDLVPSEGLQSAHLIARLPRAWETVQAQVGTVGSSRVRVALIDAEPIDVTHPDLYLNIFINWKELPADPFDRDGDGVVTQTDINALDCDGDGELTFWDYALCPDAPAIVDVTPPDINNNGRIDAVDFWQAFHNNLNEDHDDNDYFDDLHGWNFSDDNQPPGSMIGQQEDTHHTSVAQVLGAVGNNGTGIAGTAWRVSIIPIVAGFIQDPMGPRPEGWVPDTLFFDAVTYAESANIAADIVSISMGWQFARQGTFFPTQFDSLFTGCHPEHVTKNIPAEDYDWRVEQATNAFRGPPWIDSTTNEITSRALYIFAGGNSAANISDPGVFMVPATPLRTLMPGRVLIVGNAQSWFKNDWCSGFGVDLWSPGEWSLYQCHLEQSICDFRYDSVNGTSLAAPTVAGVAALILSMHPEWIGESYAPYNISNRLLSTASWTVDVAEYGSWPLLEEDQPLLNAGAAVAH